MASAPLPRTFTREESEAGDAISCLRVYEDDIAYLDAEIAYHTARAHGATADHLTARRTWAVEEHAGLVEGFGGEAAVARMRTIEARLRAEIGRESPSPPPQYSLEDRFVMQWYASRFRPPRCAWLTDGDGAERHKVEQGVPGRDGMLIDMREQPGEFLTVFSEQLELFAQTPRGDAEADARFLAFDVVRKHPEAKARSDAKASKRARK